MEIVTSLRNLNILTRKTSIVACGRMLYTFTYKRSDVVDCVLAFDPFTDDSDKFLCVIDFPIEARDIRCMACKLGGVWRSFTVCSTNFPTGWIPLYKYMGT